MTNTLRKFKRNDITGISDDVGTGILSIQENIFGWISLLNALVVTLAVPVLSTFLDARTPPILAIPTIILIWLTVPRRLLPYKARVILHLIIITPLVAFGVLDAGVSGGTTIGLFVILLFAAILLDRRFSVFFLVAFSLFLLFASWQAAAGNLALNTERLNALASGDAWFDRIVASAAQLIVITSVTIALTRSTQTLLNRQQSLTKTIGENRTSLENRVAESTRTLESIATLSRTMSNFLDRQQLIGEVVDQIQEAFDYYHVHVYLLDKSGQNLVMAGGTGEAGSALVIGRHKLSVGEGIVGLAAQEKDIVLVQNVEKNESWLPNTLLPETKSEISLPLILEDEVLGVLDVQDNAIYRFRQNDVDLLATIASQFAISLRNAAIYEEVQASIKHQTHINNVGQKIQLSPNVTFTIHTAARELYQSLNANRVGVTLFPKALKSDAASEEQQAQ